MTANYPSLEPAPGEAVPLPFSIRKDRFNPSSMAAEARAVEALLIEYRVRLSPHSWLARAIVNATVRLQDEVLLDGSVPFDADAQRRRLGWLREAGDLVLLSRALQSAKAVLSPSDLRRSLHLLAKGSHSLTAKTQQSRERDLAFELMVAAWVGKFSTEVALLQPDVTCRFEDTVWGLACKTAYVGPHGVRGALRNAIRQIEGARVQAGLVFIRVSDIYPHERLEPPPGSDPLQVRAFIGPEALMKVAQDALAELVADVVREIRIGDRGSLIQWTPRLRGIALVGHTFAHVMDEEEPVPSIMALHHGIIQAEPPPKFATLIHKSMGI